MRRPSEVQEALVHLYLRLNGYFVTNFIVHSPEYGRNRTEIDALAVRFPYNREPEREVPPSTFLAPSARQIDVLLCEVKSRGQQLQFNRSLRARDSLMSVLRWVGVFPEQETREVVSQLLPLLEPSFNSLEIPEVALGNVRVRALLCAPERWQRHRNQRVFLSGEEIFGYIWRCLCPPRPRQTCSTRYDFRLWGDWLEPIVRYFKHRQEEGFTDPGRIEDLYAYLGLTTT